MPEETAMITVDELIRAIEAEDQSTIHWLASQVHYADLAQCYLNISGESRALYLKSIGPKLSADLIVELPDSIKEEALNHFSPSELKVLLRELSDDDRVDILQAVGDEARLRFLGLLGPEDEELTRSLLRYGPETAGGRMTTKFGRLFASMNVKQAIEHLRQDQESTETLSRIFVINAKGHLIGRVRLRDLAFNPWETPIRDIMEEVAPEQRIVATADQEDAANLLLRYDLIVLPVIDEFDHMLGIITHDDAMEILREESTEDIERFAGITGEQDETNYLGTGIIRHFRRRSGWLVGLAFVALISGYVMMHFGSMLEQVFVLALFLPMVVGAGGNSGVQATTMVIRAMSLNELTAGTAARVARRELLTGLMLGSLLGLTMAAFSLFVLPAFNPALPASIGYIQLALAVGVALIAQVTSATFLGSLLPFAARAAKLDPAVVSAPAIAAIVDITGMAIYFTIAQSILTIAL